MACKNCKKKQIKSEFMSSKTNTPKEVKVVFFTLSFFAIYGIVSFVADLIEWIFR